MTEKFKQVRVILMEDWDPIGVKAFEEAAADEYDIYINQLLSMPIEEISTESIANYLKTVVRDRMGLEPYKQKAEEAAVKLLPILKQ